MCGNETIRLSNKVLMAVPRFPHKRNRGIYDVIRHIWPNLELQEGRHIFSQSCSIRSLVSPRKSIKLNSLRGGGGNWHGIFGPCCFYPEKYGNIRKASTFKRN